MKDDYYIIDKSILPEYFDNVLQAKSLVDDENLSVSVACKQTGISRSTFYKYKDKIFRASKSFGKKSIITLKLADAPGVLGNVLSLLCASGVSIVTINSSLPIKEVAFVTLVLDVSALATDLEELIQEVRKLSHVKSAKLVAME